MADLITNDHYKALAIQSKDFIESRTNKRKEEKTDRDDLSSVASECRYTVGGAFNY